MKRIELSFLEKKIQKYLLDKKEKNPSFDIDKFLNPSVDDLYDPFLLDGMNECKNRIERAIKNKEKILIYGDYDCDGISAATILYLFFKSRGLLADVYIPSRFDDGYGLSIATIDEIENNFHPNLIITVDLGITAVKETDEVKKRGMDIIITDHHEVGDGVPRTIVIDPKIPGQKYPYNGLCGAGVALKVVQALAGKDEAYKYFDIACLATIGDIVPLTEENRAIAKLGLDIINRGESRASIKYMLNVLELNHVNSTDVSFKIVPRINASGRMDKAIKVFEFFIAESEESLREKYIQIEADNIERLREIQLGNEEIDRALSDIDVPSSKIMIISGNFHQGVLGILASRVCHDYNRPAICFTLSEDGNSYYGSGRSTADIDLHSIVLGLSNLTTRSGGHKMAIGLEVPKQNFNEFKSKIISIFNKEIDESKFLLPFDYSLEIDENDINKKFIDDLEYLEPCGCGNEAPTTMLKLKELEIKQMPGKSYKHYKFITPKNKTIVAFSASKYVSLMKNSAEKEIVLSLENNEFKNKKYPQGILKAVKMTGFNFDETRQENMISSLMNLASFSDIKKCHEFNKKDYLSVIKNNTKSLFGNIVVIDNSFDYAFASKIEELGYTMSPVPLPNKQNIILVRPEGLHSTNFIQGYNQVFYLRRCFEFEHANMAKHYKVFEPNFITKPSTRLNTSRSVFGSCFVAIRDNLSVQSNNVFEWAESVSKLTRNISKAQLVLSLVVFNELGIFNFTEDSDTGFTVKAGENFDSKRELSESKIYREITKIIESFNK